MLHLQHDEMMTVLEAQPELNSVVAGAALLGCMEMERHCPGLSWPSADLAAVGCGAPQLWRRKANSCTMLSAIRVMAALPSQPPTSGWLHPPLCPP